LAVLVRAEPDLIAFETIPSQKEAEALVELLKEFPNVKAWLSFNCKVIMSRVINDERIQPVIFFLCMIFE
jgi:homocysteine S-methyltransferase